MKKILFGLIGVLGLSFFLNGDVFAATSDCRDIEFVFVRGSGAARNESSEWKQFKSAMAKVAKRRGYSYRVSDLGYPAISVATPINALGAKIGGGKAFAFGQSVSAGVLNLKNYYRNTVKNCASTKWVFGGYSQGALVVSQSIKSFNSSKIIYVGLLGDPWTNLPEGKGIFPKACFGKNLSSYRVYAPNCRTNTGSLGAKNPYVTSDLEGKYGLWCNRNDYICGSSRSLLNNSGHTKYAEKNELIWMADKVEKRLLDRYNSTTALASVTKGGEDDIEDVIEAHFTADEYRIGMGGDVVVDASQSFSFGHEIVEYWWSINGGNFQSSGTESAITRTLSFPWEETITVRVVDDIGRTAEASVKILTFEGEPVENVMLAPKYVTAECDNDEIVINWTDKKHILAKYILIRVNDVDLDYVPIENLKATISNIESIEKIESIKVAWLDKDLELGEWAEVELNCSEPVNVDPVETGVASVSLALLVVGFCSLAVMVCYKKYLP